MNTSPSNEENCIVSYRITAQLAANKTEARQWICAHVGRVHCSGEDRWLEGPIRAGGQFL